MAKFRARRHTQKTLSKFRTRRHTEETIEKISKALIGSSNETLKKFSDAAFLREEKNVHSKALGSYRPQ